MAVVIVVNLICVLAIVLIVLFFFLPVTKTVTYRKTIEKGGDAIMKEEVTKKDPVCGMEVEEGNEAARYEYQGKIYLFCSKHCAEEFKEEPEKYLESV